MRTTPPRHGHAPRDAVEPPLYLKPREEKKPCRKPLIRNYSWSGMRGVGSGAGRAQIRGSPKPGRGLAPPRWGSEQGNGAARLACLARDRLQGWGLESHSCSPPASPSLPSSSDLTQPRTCLRLWWASRKPFLSFLADGGGQMRKPFLEKLQLAQ